MRKTYPHPPLIVMSGCNNKADKTGRNYSA
jgi:hypothetical protein